jgi:hypothetical protein
MDMFVEHTFDKLQRNLEIWNARKHGVSVKSSGRGACIKTGGERSYDKSVEFKCERRTEWI